MRRILAEPLLAFLLLGGVIFFVFQQLSNNQAPERQEIVVTQGRILALSAGFEKVWQRSVTQEELDALIRNYVREEILYREALAMGLDRDDTIVKRRLRQKLVFLSEDIAGLETPTDRELQDYLDAHRLDYREATRYSFTQVYIDINKRGDGAVAEAGKLLKTLQTQDQDVTLLGDRLMVRQQFGGESEREIERALGSKFVKSLGALPTGSWQGPIESGFGLHLVRIDERIVGKYPQLESVRKQVMRDWSAAKRKKTNEEFYQKLRQQYKVSVEAPNEDNEANLSLSKAKP